MTAREPFNTPTRAKDTVDFALNLDKIHIFDKETEKTITD